MHEIDAIARLAALSQETRVRTFRLLVAAGPAGMAPGQIARRLSVPDPTLSAHLAVLARSGLVRGRREGRSIVYSVNTAAMRELITWLVADCCGGRPEICGLLVEQAPPGEGRVDAVTDNA